MLRCWAALILLGEQASATPGPTPGPTPAPSPAPSPAPTGPTCGAGYTLVSWGTGESKCLQLTASGRTFDECATTECPKRGGHLACIGSAQEFDAVFDEFSSDPCADGGCDGRRRLGAGELKGGYPAGCAFVGQNLCNSKEEWEWTTTSCAGVDPEAVWAGGQPDNWAGAEKCGMMCNQLDGGLHDGPCHNTIHCLCEERVARTEELNYDNFDKGSCPEPVWWGLYIATFLIGFVWCFSAGYGCCGIPRMKEHNKKQADNLCCGILFILTFLQLIFWLIISPAFGMNPIIGLMGGLGDVVGITAAWYWSRYTNEHWYPPEPPVAPAPEPPVIVGPSMAPVAYGGEVATAQPVIQGAVVMGAVKEGTEPPPLHEICDALKRNLGLDGNFEEVVNAACLQLGVAPTGSLPEKADACWRAMEG